MTKRYDELFNDSIDPVVSRIYEFRIEAGDTDPISVEEIAVNLREHQRIQPVGDLVQEYNDLDPNTRYTIALAWVIDWYEDFQNIVAQMNKEFAETEVA